MQLLKKRILQDGKCYEGGILKVDGFINHQMDPVLMKSIGVEFVRRFAATNVNKIMTIEASGIAPAIMTGYLMDLPVETRCARVTGSSTILAGPICE